MNTPFVKVETYTKVCVDCPLCKHPSFTVGHLFEEAKRAPEGYRWVRWACKECHAKFDINIYADEHVEMSQIGVEDNPYVPAVVLLKSDTGGDRPIYAVAVTGGHRQTIKEEVAKPGSSHLDYYYGEGTCPTNWFRDVVTLIQDGDPDPHGCFKFNGIRELDDVIAFLKSHPECSDRDFSEDNYRDLVGDFAHLIFPELFESGEIYDNEETALLNADGVVEDTIEGYPNLKTYYTEESSALNHMHLARLLIDINTAILAVVAPGTIKIEEMEVVLKQTIEDTLGPLVRDVQYDITSILDGGAWRINLAAFGSKGSMDFAYTVKIVEPRDANTLMLPGAFPKNSPEMTTLVNQLTVILSVAVEGTSFESVAQINDLVHRILSGEQNRRKEHALEPFEYQLSDSEGDASTLRYWTIVVQAFGEAQKISFCWTK